MVRRGGARRDRRHKTGVFPALEEIDHAGLLEHGPHMAYERLASNPIDRGSRT
jgi:hypothetical protein